MHTQLAKHRSNRGSRVANSPRLGLNARGNSLVELLVVLLVAGICLGTALPALKQLNNPLRNGSHELLAFFKEARAKAIASTLAYAVSADSATQVSAAFAKSCSAEEFSPDPGFMLQFPAGAQLSSVEWRVCFDPRGMADQSADVSLVDHDSRMATVQVFLGGAARIAP